MSGREDAVAERIERIGYAVLAPRAKFEINGKMRISAIFPGYIFAEVRSSWYDIKNQPGVTRIIMAGEQPARVPDAEIDDNYAKDRAQRACAASSFAKSKSAVEWLGGENSYWQLPGLECGLSRHERQRAPDRSARSARPQSVRRAAQGRSHRTYQLLRLTRHCATSEIFLPQILKITQRVARKIESRARQRVPLRHQLSC